MLKKGRFKVQNGNFEVRFLKSPITLEAHICTSLVSNIVKQTLKAVFGFFFDRFCEVARFALSDIYPKKCIFTVKKSLAIRKK